MCTQLRYPMHTVASSWLVWRYSLLLVCTGAEANHQMGYMEFCYDVKTHVGLDIILWNLNLMKVFGKNSELCEFHVRGQNGRSRMPHLTCLNVGRLCCEHNNLTLLHQLCSHIPSSSGSSSRSVHPVVCDHPNCSTKAI